MSPENFRVQENVNQEITVMEVASRQVAFFYARRVFLNDRRKLMEMRKDED